MCRNPLDCLCYYRDWKNSVYYVVEASGDLDEDGVDTKISCTRLRLLKELDFKRLLLHGVAYMEKYPERPWNQYVQKETGTSYNGFALYGERLRPLEEKAGCSVAFKGRTGQLPD
mgnify:CR=1 FL=1